MTQILFVLGLHGLGVSFGCLFRQRVPFFFICASGFLWGSLWYALSVLLLLNLGLPYSPGILGVFATVTMAGILYALIRQKAAPLNRRAWAWLIGSTLLLTGIGLLAQRFNYTQTTPDSLSIITAGRNLTLHGLNRFGIEALALRGAYAILMHSAGTFTPAGYLNFFHAVLAIQFLFIFIGLSIYSLQRRGLTQFTAMLLTLLTIPMLFGTEFIVFQALYIHMNLPAGVFLFTAIVTFWLGMEEESSAWLAFSTLGWIGFSLSRVEGPLFTVVLLALGLGICRLPYRLRLTLYLPSIGFILVWYTSLLLRMEDGTYILDPSRTLVIIAAAAGLAALVALTRFQWVERLVQNALPELMLIGLAIGLYLAFNLKPDHMQKVLKGVTYPMFINGRWDAGWYLALFLFTLAIFQPHRPYDRFLSLSVITFLLLLVLLDFPASAPYRPTWGGSANRMLVHIYVLPFFYALIKIAPQMPVLFAASRKSLSRRVQTALQKVRHLSWVLSALLALVWATALGHLMINLLNRMWGERIGWIVLLTVICLAPAAWFLNISQAGWKRLSATKRALTLTSGVLIGIIWGLLLILAPDSTALTTRWWLEVALIACQIMGLIILCAGLGIYWMSFIELKSERI